MKRILCSIRWVFLCLSLFVTGTASADKFETTLKVDTLKLRDMINLRTNMLGWLTTTPNIGIEVGVKPRNWGLWTIGADVWYNPATKHTYTQDIVYNTFGADIEFRHYWRTRKMSKEALNNLVDSATINAYGDERLARNWHSSKYDPLGFHTGILDRLFSLRRKKQKHIQTTYYRGVYVAYNDFSLKLSEVGRQGRFFSAGVSYGIVRPMYIFKNKTSLDLEFGFKMGVGYGNISKYTRDSESNCYPVTEKGSWQIMKTPVVQDIRVGLVYRLGKKHIGQIYRKRYDCDPDFRAKTDSVFQARYLENREQRYSDRKTMEIEKTFLYVVDSLTFVNARNNQIKEEQDIITRMDEISHDTVSAHRDSIGHERKKIEKKAEKLKKYKSDNMVWNRKRDIKTAKEAGMLPRKKEKKGGKNEK